jgi:hypothetical protein
MIDAASQAGSLEWLLNALWLLLTLAAAWSVYRGARCSRLRDRAVALIALACAATILFPAISVSDDVHDQQWSSEDISLKIKKHDQSAGPLSAPQTALPQPLFAVTNLPAFVVTGMLSRNDFATLPDWYAAPVAVRAPPSTMGQPF